MRLFLYLRLINDPLQFDEDLARRIKTLRPDLTLLEVDNFSDETTIHYALESLKSASDLLVYIEGSTSGEIGSAIKILSRLGKMTVPFLILDHGKNEMIKTLLKRWENRVVKGYSLDEFLKNFK